MTIINVKRYRAPSTPEITEMLDNMRKQERLPVDRLYRYMAMAAEQLRNRLDQDFIDLMTGRCR